MKSTGSPIRALVLVSNSISAAMARHALEMDGYNLSEVALIKLRQMDLEWSKACAVSLDYGRKPSLTLQGQIKVAGFYARAIRVLKRCLALPGLQDIYLANVDNILCNHALRRHQSGRLRKPIRVSIVAEGFMNYQDIATKDRAAWRWKVKPWIAATLGLTYAHPQGHLSGSFEPGVSRVFAYSPIGLQAPPERFVEANFPASPVIRSPDPSTALVVLTGIGQWMQPAQFEQFKAAFTAWVNGLGFDKVLYKSHPYYPSGGIEDQLINAEPLKDPRRLEDMSGEIPAATIIGYCTTGLVTLRLMRPDLRIIDWGSDLYCEYAYHGDRSIVSVLRSAGVEVVESESRAAA